MLKTTENHLGDKLRIAMTEKGVTQASIAREFGVKPPTVSVDWLRFGRIDKKHYPHLVSFFNKPYAWWFGDETNNQHENPQKTQLFAVESAVPDDGKCNTAIAPNITGVVPLISWVQAGAWCAVNDIFQPGDADEFYPTTAKVGKNAFALRVRGDSMEPKFQDGCIIIVDPDKESYNGAFVVVRESDTDEATFKQLQIDGSRRYLKPVNPRYPIMEMRSETLICGVVVKMEMDV
jgi:SOS-response transcriptional repressor LexA